MNTQQHNYFYGCGATGHNYPLVYEIFVHKMENGK